MSNIHEVINMVTLIKHGVLFISMFLLSAMAQAEDVIKFSKRYYADITSHDKSALWNAISKTNCPTPKDAS
jgi:hypothetical protein